MLAAVRIGAIHCVVFAGFGAGALGDRIRRAARAWSFTADVTWRKGKDVAAHGDRRRRARAGRRRRSSTSSCCGAATRRAAPARTATWSGTTSSPRGEGGAATPGRMAAKEPAFILATSGTTARPKLAVHVHGGYGVHVARDGRWVFGLRPGRRLVVDLRHRLGRRPQLHRLRAAAAPAARRSPTRARSTIPARRRSGRSSRSDGVTGVFTSPTARPAPHALRRGAARAARPPLAGARVLRRRGAQRARLGVAAARRVRGPRPVIDHMWQTETGGPMFGNPYGLAILPIKPGSAGVPLPGIDADVVNARTASRCARARRGSWCVRRPFPGLTPTLWGEPERYATDYWSDPGRLLRPATPRTSTRTATCGSPAAPTRSSRSPATASARSRSRPRSCATPPSPRPASPAGPTSCAARSSPRSWRCARGTSRRRSSTASCSRRCAASSGRWR